MTLEPGWEVGLQPERTALAWSRTALTFAGVGLLLLRGWLVAGTMADLLGVAVAWGSALMMSVIARIRRRQVQDTIGRMPLAAVRPHVLLVTSLALVVGACVLVGYVC